MAVEQGKEMNICGVLVRTLPERAETVAESLNRMPGVEVHQRNAEGRIVVTVEDIGNHWVGDTITRIHNVKGVLAASLVYHYCDKEQSAEEIGS